MTLFRSDRIIGRYAATNVSALFRQQAQAIFTAGGGVVNARTLLRGVGFRFGNASMTAMFREFREIAAKRGPINSLRNEFRPTANTITRVGVRFRTRFNYQGQITMRDAVSGERVTFGANFGDDRLLTGEEIRDRLQAIAEQAEIKGGPGYFDDAQIVNIQITGGLESSTL